MKIKQHLGNIRVLPVGTLLERHPLSTPFPNLSEDQAKNLRSSLQTHGQQNPIVLLADKIIDRTGGSRRIVCSCSRTKNIKLKLQSGKNRFRNKNDGVGKKADFEVARTFAGQASSAEARRQRPVSGKYHASGPGCNTGYRALPGGTPRFGDRRLWNRFALFETLAFGSKSPCNYTCGSLFRLGDFVKDDEGKEVCVLWFDEE